jgi:hypothetical protein
LPSGSVVAAEIAAQPAAEAATEPAAPRFEVVHDHEPALLKIEAQRRRLGIGHRPPVDLDDVGERVAEHGGIVERQRVDLVDVRVDEADLLHDAHEVPLRQGIAVAPRRPAAVPVAAGTMGVFQADERELSVVGDVGIFVKGTARPAELRERGDRRQQDEAGGRQHTRAHGTARYCCGGGLFFASDR